MILTYEKAREMSIWAWKKRAKGHEPGRTEFLEKFDFYPAFDCGFCSYFDSCEDCPLYWEDAEAEEHSAYTLTSLPCTRNFWHWYYWYKEGNERWAKYWAKKVLEEIKATPEEEE